ncbi:hypothetical protein GOODEAATRI_001209 [Goodea atripinnis]|uniref:Uncharacterized protein n=1 Tax=Goodea atripinnis TaxID=208336 RepID=A0ABV0P0F8_9TELE
MKSEMTSPGGFSQASKPSPEPTESEWVGSAAQNPGKRSEHVNGTSRGSPVDCSVTKRSRHMSSDGAPLPYQASYPEPRVSPQTTTPPSNNPTEEKRVIVPAGEASRLPRAGVLRHKMVSQRLANSSSCATPVTESEMCLCQILRFPKAAATGCSFHLF